LEVVERKQRKILNDPTQPTRRPDDRGHRGLDDPADNSEGSRW